ncbi:DUF6543 domain-containing protein [Pseudomonas sp. efr-133-TYG-5]|uniref:dermonecrotic toxin domain-containing protein n=1 Tax=Pseudomonas sp. efr-133-TYG-5 TaxID=3040310 RepID=UPI0025577573|nr:DUF6543 domain-containing protein [Pseudomonas sp. efr-133-TYG-5]
MSAPTPPLLFAEAFDAPGRWKALGTLHGLSEKDFRWLAHAKLASATLRSQQTPAMRAERILLTVGKQIPVQLPGSFVLGATPDDQGEILYTPLAGIEKFDDRAALQEKLEERLNKADEQDDLLAFFSVAQRRRLLDADGITLSFAVIAGDVFAECETSLRTALLLNAQTLCDELKQLPTLTALLDSVLAERLEPMFAKVQQRHTRVTFHPRTSQHNSRGRQTLEHLSLSEAVLLHYRHQRWPDERRREFSNPGRAPKPEDQQHWEQTLVSVSGQLPTLLFDQLERYWQAAAGLGMPRRSLFRQVLEDQLRTELLLKRDAAVLDAEQFAELFQLLRPTNDAASGQVVESVRLWEYAPNYVELAGSLMLGAPYACLYTPVHGLQMLADYADLKATLQAKFAAPGHEDELYALLNLEERRRFLGFDQPQVSGARITGEVFQTLFDAILTKQRQNIEYALQVFRHSDGAVELHALFDKALDIRAMLHQRLLALEVAGRWSTSPAFTGSQQPSLVLSDKASAAIKTFSGVEAPISAEFNAQPLSSAKAQRSYLENMKNHLAHALFVGVRGEARLRALTGSLPETAAAIVEAVFDADRPLREERLAVKGFRPDAYSLTLTAPNARTLLPLAYCVLMTERGGLDAENSGCAILWTPALGLELFDTVLTARRVLDQRLQDPVQRLGLLENLSADQQPFHQRYTLGHWNLIRDHLLLHRAQSAIEHFMARCAQIRARINEPSRQKKALLAQLDTPIVTNLHLAADHARAISRQQSLPAWLSMASAAEQQRHVELLEQWRHSVADDKDYLDGIPTLSSHVAQTLKSLLDKRFPDSALDPWQIEITPNLSLAGPACNLVEFALNHVNVAQGSGFTVGSKTHQALPKNLDPAAVRQLLAALAISDTYAGKVTQALTAVDTEGLARKQRFVRQLPWQLLQHAHAMQLQQQLSERAFDSLCQVFDMPDATARATLAGADATVSPLTLVKTAGAAAIGVQGMYLIKRTAAKAPRILFTPYAQPMFREFADDAALIAALNTPGDLQDLLIRRLPQAQQAVFRGLFQASLGQISEIRLVDNSITGNCLEHLFTDNTELLRQMLGSQARSEAQADWEAAKTLCAADIRQVPAPLPGKLAYVPLLWPAYESFKASAEALQNQHWRRALKGFIDGAMQLLEVVLLPQAPVPPAVVPALDSATLPVEVSNWAQTRLTSPWRTQLQVFETTAVALKDLTRNAKDGTYVRYSDNRTFAAVAGKVYRVVKDHNSQWQLADNALRGPRLVSRGDRLVIDPDCYTVHYGKAVSKLHNRYSNERERREVLDIEAQGMQEIRRKHPRKAQMLMQAVDLARFYAFNSLHNLAQFDPELPGTRVHTLLKTVFDLTHIDIELLRSIKKAIVPICQALVDPAEDLLNTDRFVIGSNRYFSDIIAFVLDGDDQKKVHFTEKFFSPQLDWYKSALTQPFDVDSHAQAATLIHEFAHQFSQAVDIASMEARRPFSDLISTITAYGATMKQNQERFQRASLSLTTPREELFSYWSESLREWLSFDSIPALAHACEGVLAATGKTTLDTARDAFLDPQSAAARINVILRNADSLAYLICALGRQLDPTRSP